MKAPKTRESLLELYEAAMENWENYKTDIGLVTAQYFIDYANNACNTSLSEEEAELMLSIYKGECEINASPNVCANAYWLAKNPLREA